MENKDYYWMQEALNLASIAASYDEVPIGCVIVDENGELLSTSYNEKIKYQQPSYHAEMLAIHRACEKLNTWHLDGCTIYVTLEPCMMCMGTIIQSRIKRVVFGASDPKGGCAHSCIDVLSVKGFNHYPIITSGIMQEECSTILKQFFKTKRKG